ncbi:hypothetical protein ACS0TY_014854 [Phlomoides rotata]
MKPELASEVRVYMPKMYLEAIDIARLRGDHLSALRRGSRPEIRRTNSLPFENRAVEGNVMGGSSGVANQTIPPRVKSLTWKEIQKKMEKGLCFNCDEHFVPGHKCKTP